MEPPRCEPTAEAIFCSGHLQSTASAMVWGALHGMAGGLWFFGTAWSFFVFSGAYMVWRPTSFRSAFAAAAVPHALINGSAMLLLLAASKIGAF